MVDYSIIFLFAGEVNILMDELEKYLINRAKDGDIDSFEKLISNHQKRVYNIALKVLGNKEDAYEMVQEAFIKVFRSIKSFKEQSTFSTWIYRITINVCLDYIRKQKKNTIISYDNSIKIDENEVYFQVKDDSQRPDVLYERREMQREINEAIKKLPQDQRIVIVLKDIHGFSYSEIASIVQCPEGTVKSRLNRGRVALKEILKKSGTFK